MLAASQAKAAPAREQILLYCPLGAARNRANALAAVQLLPYRKGRIESGSQKKD